MLLGSAIATSWARIQRSLALSSAEAEYAAIVMAYAEAKFVQTIIQELLGMDDGMQLRILTDSSAAKVAAERAGVRRMKHMQLKQLFLQDVVRSGELQLVKTSTQTNPADMLTKALTGPSLRRCLQMLPGLSHQDWPEDKQEPTTLTAHAMLVEVSIEQEQASLSCALREQGAGLSVHPEAEGMSFLECALLCVVTVESLALAFLWCRARCCVRRRTFRSMAVQSQTTYSQLRSSANPRFVPLPEYQVGAWEQ